MSRSSNDEQVEQPNRGAQAPRLLVRAESAGLGERAAELARELGASYDQSYASYPEQRPAAKGEVVLLVTRSGLSLKLPEGPPVRAAVELLDRPRPGRDLLRRAVTSGAKAPDELIVDATAGLGADSFHLAATGVSLTLVEREPAVAALLRDALYRARSGAYGEAAREAAGRLHLVEGDARDYLAELKRAGTPPSVVYLDPMYPKSGKAALPGKGMALLRGAGVDDEDAAALLAAAQRTATRRVVVKRARRAPAVVAAGAGGRAAAEPTGSLHGSTTRYDLYAPMIE